jgi:hypothetical protein
MALTMDKLYNRIEYMTDIKDLRKLLKIYEALPKNEYEPTYLDICKYSGRRFEEICSRILAFYFQPKNEHRFNTLFLESLFEIIDNDGYNYLDTAIKVIIEENAEGKRIDILILNDFWTIGIENKIWANVYNPLEKYKERIEQYEKPKNYKIILSLREIKNKDEIKKIEKNGFIVVSYSDLFKLVKNKIGNYIKDGNTKYLVFLYDFIQTLENMKGENIMSKELDVFFSENTDRLEDLFNLYQEFKTKKDKKRLDKLAEIHEKIIDETQDKKWQIWQGYDLWFSKNDHDIGVESWFVEENNDPTACFTIAFTSWAQKYWSQYGEQLKKLYPAGELEVNENKTLLYVFDKISGNNEDEIILKLKECYNCIISLK